MLHIFNVEDYIKKLKDENGNIRHTGGEEFYNAVTSLIELFKMQDSFQVKAMANDDGLNWWEVDELNGKKVDYCLAALGEIGEGIASRDFKWWAKTNDEDKENFITEIVDCLHFESSNIMKNIYRLQKHSIENEFCTEDEFNSIIKEMLNNFGSSISNSFGYNSIPPEDTYQKNDTNEMIKHYVYLSVSSDIDSNIDYSVYGAKTEVIQEIVTLVSRRLIVSLIRLFEIGVSCGVTFAEMLDRYKLKNALNQVRKFNGYKEGTYIKMWPSVSTGAIVEDNVVAVDLTFGKDMSLEEMVKKLNEYYKDFVIPSL